MYSQIYYSLFCIVVIEAMEYVEFITKPYNINHSLPKHKLIFKVIYIYNSQFNDILLKMLLFIGRTL